MDSDYKERTHTNVHGKIRSNMKLLQICNLLLFSTFKIYCSDYPRIKYPISYTLLPLIYSLLFDAHAVFAPKWTLTKVSVIACIVVVIFSCPNSNMRINQRTSNFVFSVFRVTFRIPNKAHCCYGYALLQFCQAITP